MIVVKISFIITSLVNEYLFYSILLSFCIKTYSRFTCHSKKQKMKNRPCFNLIVKPPSGLVTLMYCNRPLSECGYWIILRIWFETGFFLDLLYLMDRTNRCVTFKSYMKSLHNKWNNPLKVVVNSKEVSIKSRRRSYSDFPL